MPMMKQLRDSTKIIMILVVISFVGLMVFEWGMDLSGSTSRGAGSGLGSVNGAEISLQEYQRQYQMLYEDAQRRDPDGTFSEEDLARIEQQAWEEVVHMKLLQQEARRRGIRVTNRELIEFIKNNPPSDIVNLPAFQTEGQFDLQKYQQALGDPSLADTWGEYERLVRERLPIQKLQEQIVSGISVTDLELLERYREQNERARIVYVHLDPARLVPADRVSVSEEEIRRYYESNKDEFRRDESATIRYVAVRPAITAADSARVAALADSLAEAARKPEADFGQLAERHSDDRTTSQMGGDLGWVDPRAMHPAFDAAVSDLRPSDVSVPFQTPFGWHVVRLEARSQEDGQPRVQVRQVLLAIEPSAESRQHARQEAQAFARAAAEDAEAFERAATERGLEVTRPPTFEKGAVVPGVGVAPAIVDFVFTNPVGSVSGGLEHSGAYYVVRIDTRYPAGTIARERVQDAIRERLLTEKRLAAVRAMAPDIAAEVGRTGLEGAASRYALEIRTTDWFTRENNIPGIGSRTPVAGAAFGLAQGQTAGPVETDRGLYLIRLIDKRGIDEGQLEQAKPALQEQVRTEKAREVIRAWFEDLKERAEIKDNRGSVLGGV